MISRAILFTKDVLFIVFGKCPRCKKRGGCNVVRFAFIEVGESAVDAALRSCDRCRHAWSGK